MLHIVEVFGRLTRLSILEPDIILADLPNLLKERLGVSVFLNIGQTSILRSQSYIDLDVEKDGRRIVWQLSLLTSSFDFLNLLHWSRLYFLFFSLSILLLLLSW